MEDTLMHYGILGMKWGVRRTPEQLGHVRPKREKKPNYHVSVRKVKKNEKHMTDQELQKALNRLNQQNQLKSMSPSTYRKTMDFVKQWKKDAGDIVGAVAATAGLVALGKKYGGQLMHWMNEINYYDLAEAFEDAKSAF